MREKIICKIIMKLRFVSFVIIVFIDTDHNLNKRILSLLLCVDITCIFTARHQFINNTLIFLAIRIIDDMIDNLAIANNSKRPKDYKYRDFRADEGSINANNAPHMI